MLEQAIDTTRRVGTGFPGRGITGLGSTQNTTAIKDVSDEITASAMRDLDQAHNLKGRATNLNQQVSTFIL